MQNLLKTSFTLLFITISSWCMALDQKDVAQYRLGTYIMLSLLVIGIVITIIFIRRKPKDKNGKIDAQAYSADQKGAKPSFQNRPGDYHF